MRYLEFFKRQFILAHVSGIPVRADLRWIFVLILMSWITSASVFPLVENLWTSLIFGVFTTVIFFFSIFLHEYAHAFAARKEGVQVLEIVLHPFGGLARLKREPDTPRAEFLIAVAGPAASFLLTIFFVILMAIANSLKLNILALLCFLLMLGNFLIAAFNLFPGYPLDGGRVLRAYLWKRGKDLNEATVLTGHFGQMIGAFLMAFGFFFGLIRGDFFTGLWTALVGFFLFDAARGIIREIREFETIAVEQVMQLPISVAPDADVQYFVDRILPFHRRTIFLVAKEKQLYGILSLQDLKKTPNEKWRETKIMEVMRPITPDYFVETDTLLPEARELMKINGIGALGVINKKGQLVGYLQSSRTKIKK